MFQAMVDLMTTTAAAANVCAIQASHSLQSVHRLNSRAPIDSRLQLLQLEALELSEP